jgi:RNA polymerase sigma factor (sigma-70 family)
MDESVTLWCQKLRDGDEEAAAKLWNHYSERLLRYARGRLNAKTQRVYDEDDLATSAFRSVCRGITSQRIAALEGRDNFWRLLLAIAARKIMARHRYDKRQIRDQQRTLEEQDIPQHGQADTAGIDGVASDGETPELAVEIAETCATMLSSLQEPDLQQIVERKIEGFTSAEIARQLNVTERTVERKLERIRRRWQAMIEPDEPPAKADS